MTEPRRGGPKRMDDVQEFLARPRSASLCVEDGDGALCVRPVWVESASTHALHVASPGERCDVDEGAAGCVVADEFESYVGIRGAIVRGVLGAASPDGSSGFERRTLVITRVHGFSFEDTTTSL